MITFCSFLFRNSVIYDDDSKKTCLEEHFAHLVESITIFDGITNQK